MDAAHLTWQGGDIALQRGSHRAGSRADMQPAKASGIYRQKAQG
jgi:hypothetical protein